MLRFGPGYDSCDDIAIDIITSPLDGFLGDSGECHRNGRLRLRSCIRLQGSAERARRYSSMWRVREVGLPVTRNHLERFTRGNFATLDLDSFMSTNGCTSMGAVTTVRFVATAVRGDVLGWSDGRARD